MVLVARAAWRVNRAAYPVGTDKGSGLAIQHCGASSARGLEGESVVETFLPSVM